MISFSPSGPDNRSTATRNSRVSQCRAMLCGTDGISKFAATATATAVYPNRAPSFAIAGRLVTSIEDKLETGLGIPRIVAMINRHTVQIIHSSDSRNAKAPAKRTYTCSCLQLIPRESPIDVALILARSIDHLSLLNSSTESVSVLLELSKYISH